MPRSTAPRPAPVRAAPRLESSEPRLDPASAAEIEARARRLLDEGEARAAATELIRGFGPPVLRHLRRVLGTEGEAKEAFARASERIWRSLPDYRGESSLRTWVHRLAWHAAADLRKDAFRRRVRRLDTSEAGALPASQGTRSQQRLERQRQELALLREALSLEDQALLQLRIDQRLSWAECAAVLSRQGSAARPDALMKRFERLKGRLAAMARRRAEP